MAAAFPPGASNRFLIFLSYVGHEFRGIQKQKPVFSNDGWKTVSTVQNVLEDGLMFVFKPLHDVNVFSSSRTDSGVHCLRSAVHVDLSMNFKLQPDMITAGLNKHFVSHNLGVRILSTHSMPNWFSARGHAISRTYLYRFACRKDPAPVQSKFLNEIPFSEYGRTFFMQYSDLDIDKMHEAASLLQGTNNLLCFMGRPTKKKPGVTTIRTIYSLTIKPGKPFMLDHDPHANLFEYWDVVVHGRSFLYRQVRRIVGVLLAVGRGMIDLDTVQRMIDNPVPESWDSRAICVPPWGLYLLDVGFNPIHFHDFETPDCEDRMTFALGY